MEKMIFEGPAVACTIRTLMIIGAFANLAITILPLIQQWGCRKGQLVLNSTIDDLDRLKAVCASHAGMIQDANRDKESHPSALI